MGYIIITMPKRSDANRLKEIIQRSGIWEEIVICTTGSETLRITKKYETSLVICSRKFSDMGYEELHEYLSMSIAMILLTKDYSILPPSNRVEKLLMPFRREDLIRLVQRGVSRQEIEHKPKKKRRSPQEQLQIDKAKEHLMNIKKMSEPDAFRYIQKMSMDTGRSLVDTAQMILLLGVN